MIDYSEKLGKLPERAESHVKNEKGRLAFRSLFKDPLFIVREETDNDYGVDIQIEAIINDGKTPTNIRTHVQLKSSSKKSKKNGGYSYRIAIPNLNYMVNHPVSFYAFYSLNEDKFFYKNTDNVYLLQNQKEGKNANFITINFDKELNNDAVRQIHKNLIDTTILFKDLRLKLHEGGFIPGSQLVYGELFFETSAENLEEYLIKDGFAYAYSTDENGKVIFLHNLIWELHHGPIPQGYQVYHINGNTLDNRSDNLDIMKTIDNFDIEGFQKEIEEYQARNILSLILEGSNAEIEDVPPPPRAMLYKIIDELKKNGWNADDDEMSRIKADMGEILGIQFNKN